MKKGRLIIVLHRLEISLRVQTRGTSLGRLGTGMNSLAEKLLRKHNRYAKTAIFTLPGNPALVAGVTVMLEGWGGWDGKYIVTQAKHTVDGSGYIVQVRLRRVLEGY